MKRWIIALLTVIPIVLYAVTGEGKSRVEKNVFQSASLGEYMPYRIYLPPNYDTNKRYPVLYLIHGYNCNEDFFFTYIGLKRATDKLILSGKIAPLIIVTPFVKNSFCINSAEKTGVVIVDSNTLAGMAEGRYEDYVVRDLVTYIDTNYPTLANRENRFIGGISMGGFGALYLAFRHPELFSKVGGHSSGLFTNETSTNRSWLYPDEKTRDERDPVRLAKTVNLDGLKIYLDCGKEDGLYPGSEALYRALKSRKADVEFHSGPGAHLLPYWISHAEEYLLFYGKK